MEKLSDLDESTIDKIVTKEALDKLDVTMPKDTNGYYPTAEEFIEADDVAKQTAKNLLDTFDEIMEKKSSEN